jgi:LPXTG-motif cell wall-anchored protein
MTRFTHAARRGLAAVGVAGIAAVGFVPAASADEVPDPQYAGPSTLSTVCVGDIPYLSGTVDFGDPFANEDGEWEWRDADGNLRLSGTFTTDDEGKATFNEIWPGASEDPPDWPGWTLVDGEWVVDPTDEGAWTRFPEGVATTVSATVNPTVSASLVYPPATAICAGPPTSTPPPPGETPPVCDDTPGDNVNDDLPVCQELPVTGANVGTAALIGVGLVAVGAGAVALSRRRAGPGSEV